MTESSSPYLDSVKVRSAFPVLNEVTYLNVGTYGIMPEPALKTFVELLTEFERKGVASAGNLSAKANETRERIAALLGSNAKEIAYTRDATDGINLVLAGLSWQAGDEVVTTDEEHEAMIHPLLYLQATKGIRVKRAPVSPDAGVMLERISALVTPRTRLIGMSHVTCETGSRLPAREISEWARSHGILTLFDGAQAVGAFHVNVRDLGCDFYAGNGHKWLCGPKGTGIFYGRLDKLVELIPAHVGAGSLAWVDLHTGAVEAWASALRFEYGTRAWALYAGIGASLDWYENLGWQNVERHIEALSNYLKERILERPYLQLLSPRPFQQSSGLVVFKAPGNLHWELGRQLRDRYKIASRMIPHYNAVRVSTAHFNDTGDIDRLMAAIDEIVRGH